MPRPKMPRRICGKPHTNCFKPNAIPLSELETVTIGLDEFEAMRLVDHQGMQQLQAAEVMGVSRQTLANLVKRARAKTTACLVEGKALVFESEESC
ncbi:MULTISPECIES: DUF134 domain-containing protein [Salinivibrio]|nr:MULTISPECIES: DUF134 domain-containing protein [Salinivibrio]OOE74536.1 hypothetical protein BZG23_07785 [Salinivibrio sp. ML290]OOE82297.1 hypothetical protein BZG25_00095 [Salinivibrio sp. ML198]OOE85839.1 hypothetical protein BZG73_06980 [Salinivibrio siamensis]SIO38371.1 Predicted DNA-binding protein, UPF0251 family [Salinivibrio sp. ES.052]